MLYEHAKIVYMFEQTNLLILLLQEWNQKTQNLF